MRKRTGRLTFFEHYTVLREAGPYELIVPRGTYYLVAFQDLNRDLIYQAGEPAGQYGQQALGLVEQAGGVTINLNIQLDASAAGEIAFPETSPVTGKNRKPSIIHLLGS